MVKTGGIRTNPDIWKFIISLMGKLDAQITTKMVNVRGTWVAWSV